jgi:hypothetical protein
VLNPKNSIVGYQPTIIFKKLFIARTIAVPIIFLFGILIWPLSRMYAEMSPILVWPVFAYLRLLYKRKYLREVKKEELVAEVGEETGSPS